MSAAVSYAGINILGQATTAPQAEVFSAAANFLKKINSGGKQDSTPNIDSAEMARRIKKDCEKPAKNKDGHAECYSAEMEKLSLRYDYKYAYDVLHALQKIDNIALRQCHVINHGIGWGVYKMDPENWKSYIGKLSSECAYGSTHGLMEKYVATLPDGKITEKEVAELCIGESNIGCAHALGHLIVVSEEADMDKALALCEAIEDKGALNSCYSGAFMEHHIAPTLVLHGLAEEGRENWPSFLYKDEEFCNTYTGIKQEICWTRLSASAEQYFKSDPVKTFEFCNRAPNINSVRGCKTGSFTQLFYAVDFDFPTLQRYCMIASEDDPAFETICYKEIVNIAFAVFKPEKADTILPFCSSLSDDYQKDCFGRIGFNFKIYKTRGDVITGICEEVRDIDLRSLCIGGNIF